MSEPDPTPTPAAPSPPPKPGDWMEVPQTLANGVHAALGCLVMLTTAFFVRPFPHALAGLAGVQAFLAAFVLTKEYWYDLRYETGETVRSSTEDALGWLFGSVVFWVIFAIGHFTGAWS